MKSLSGLDWVAVILVIVGALNWGLVGAFSFDLVEAILGSISVLQQIVYIVVGLAGIYLAVMAAQLSKKSA